MLVPMQRRRVESAGDIERKEAAKQRLKERKQAEAREATQAAVAKALSAEGSRKKRDMKAQKAQEVRGWASGACVAERHNGLTYHRHSQERLAAKRADAGVQPGTIRRIQKAAGTVVVFPEGVRPYWETGVVVPAKAARREKTQAGRKAH